jgi:hypothetical protein
LSRVHGAAFQVRNFGGDDPTLEADGIDLYFYGLWAYVYNLLFGAAALAAKKRKLEKLRSEVLPQFPKALVCPGCLYIERKP